MGIKERKARQKETLRQEILDAARQILISEGIERLSMRSIAARIEYTPTTIYLYFKDKADLLFHLCEEVYGKMADTMEAAGAAISDPVECLRATMRAYIEFAFSEPVRYRIALMTDVAPTVDPSAFLKAGTRGITAYELVKERMRQVMGKTVTEDGEIEALTQTLWAMAHGIVSLVITHSAFPWVEREALVETGIRIATEPLIGIRRNTSKEEEDL